MDKNKLIAGLWIFSAIISLVAVAFAIAYFTMQGQNDNYKEQLEYVYERSFYDLVDNVNNIEINLSKLGTSKSDIARKELIAKIISQTNMAQNNLATLPIDSNEIGNTVSFINYVNGYLTSLNQKLGKNKSLNADDLENIENLYNCSQNIKSEVNRYAVLLEGDYKIIDNAKDSTYELSRFSQTFSTLKEPSVDYPELIYDGPFSDSVVNKEVKGLSSAKITQAQADEILKGLKTKIGFESFEYIGESNGKIPTFDYNLNFQNNSHGYIQITQNGGKVLTYSHNIEEKYMAQDTEKYTLTAIEFAKNMGYENMVGVWCEKAQNTAYVNLVYDLDGIAVYPDMIKVKFTNDYEVCGFEASTYFYNHIERTAHTPKLTLEKAKENLPSDIFITQNRLVIIPGEYVGELYAYEFECEKNQNTFFIYINADTGEQENILRVIQTENGELLM